MNRRLSESKTEKSRFWLSLMLDDLSEGDIFEPGRLHVTILPWFVSEIPEPEIKSSFLNKFADIEKFNLAVGEEKKFGPKRNVNVNLLLPDKSISNLHARSLDWFKRINARWAVKNPHIDEDYKPHIRRRRGTKLNEGQKLEINSISLIKAARTEDGKREVAAKILLK